ncbi:MAG: glycosyltransferase family 2 protein [Desulfamplus sp.]|nr:glycosyltransferase family 2 protein [Desulfamplus sp.]
MLISILLVSHNNRKDLELLLPSLKQALKNLNKRANKSDSGRCLGEILLVDNCSSDLTVDFVKKNFPDVVITINKQQMGYGANQNQNIARAKGEFILLMNPDMVLPPELLNTMINFMEQNQDAAISTCKVCNEDGSCQYLNKREPAIIDLFIRRFFPDIRKSSTKNLNQHREFQQDYQDNPKKSNYTQNMQIFDTLLPSAFNQIITKRLDYYEMKDVGYDKVVDVPFISGSFMFAKTSIIKELNGFDERFFMYFEDVDLCRRVRSKARLLYCPDVRVIHRWERASHKSLKWTFVFALSGLKYFYKWGFRFI